jgi:hypothetical protein
MPSWIKLPLAPALLAAFALPAVSGCASNSTPDSTSVYSGSEDSGASSADSASPASEDSGGNPVSTSDSGASSGADSGATCALPDLWSQDPTCDACQEKFCCASILACAGNTACTAIYSCQSNCYSGEGLDGGSISAAPIDDAGDSEEDLCAATCLAEATPAAQALFNPQDTCVNTTSCSVPCD